MTHAQLFTLKDFDKLSSDSRMAGLINALRRAQPTSGGGDAHHLIRDAGRGEGWKACIDEIEKLMIPPKLDDGGNSKPPAYSSTIRVPRENISGFNSNNTPA